MNFVVVSSVGIKWIVCNGMHKKFRTSLNTGQIGPTVAELCPFIVKMACKHSTGHVFSLIDFNFSQNDVIDKMSVKFETGSCGVKNRSLGQIIASCVVRYQQFPLKAYSSYTLGRLTRNLVGSFEVT